MNSAAGLTHHGVIGAARIAGLGIFRQPVLHIQAGARTFEDQIGHTLVSLTPAGFCALISVNVAATRSWSPIAGSAGRRESPDRAIRGSMSTSQLPRGQFGNDHGNLARMAQAVLSEIEESD